MNEEVHMSVESKEQALLTTRQAAEFLGMSETTLKLWRWHRTGPS